MKHSWPLVVLTTLMVGPLYVSAASTKISVGDQHFILTTADSVSFEEVNQGGVAGVFVNVNVDHESTNVCAVCGDFRFAMSSLNGWTQAFESAFGYPIDTDPTQLVIVKRNSPSLTCAHYQLDRIPATIQYIQPCTAKMYLKDTFLLLLNRDIQETRQHLGESEAILKSTEEAFH